MSVWQSVIISPGYVRSLTHVCVIRPQWVNRNSCWYMCELYQYSDVIMDMMASQITSLTIVYITVYSALIKKKTSKLRVTGLCAGNSPVTGEFLAQMAFNAENVSIWWRHHDCFWLNPTLNNMQRNLRSATIMSEDLRWWPTLSPCTVITQHCLLIRRFHTFPFPRHTILIIRARIPNVW